TLFPYTTLFRSTSRGNCAGERDRAIERYRRDRSVVRSSHRGESETGCGFQSRQRGFAEFPQRPGHEIVEGQSQSAISWGNSGAKVKVIRKRPTLNVQHPTSKSEIV